jgi:hypothetical protein
MSRRARQLHETAGGQIAEHKPSQHQVDALAAALSRHGLGAP